MRNFHWLAVLGACACGGSTPPPERAANEPRSMTVQNDGETTLVTITDDPPPGPNATCAAYCDRLAACWAAMPGADPMVDEETAKSRCLAEHDACRTGTTEPMCCAELTDCGEFSRCQARGKDVIVVCERKEREEPKLAR